MSMLLLLLSSWFVAPPVPKPIGQLVDLGGHRLHLFCTGRGNPTVVVETGLGDYSFDWVLVRQQLRGVRVCTYDRAGYAWSDPGPLPRTFDQLNFELHAALERLGEHGPFVLVGHSFGAQVVRQYAYRYPQDVSGMVLVEGISEDQFINMGPGVVGRIRDGARGVPIPEPQAVAHVSAVTGTRTISPSAVPAVTLESPYDRLPAAERQLHIWAAGLSDLEAAENSQREWAAEYMARWAAAPQPGTLGRIPLVVLTRALGGYRNTPAMSADQLEQNRLEAQAALAKLSTAGIHRIVQAGHNLHLEAPGAVAEAIQEVVALARRAR